MANDDLTQKLSGNDEDRTTQPTLMAVLALVREVKDSVDRLSGQVTELRSEVTELRSEVTRLSARLDEVESRLARDIAGLGYKIEALNKSRLQTEADYSSLFDRVSKLESKIS
jgi:predicted nuclease with TOPRIM domain